MGRPKRLVVFSVIILAVAVSGCSYLQPEPEVRTETKIEEVKVAVVNREQVWLESEKGQQYQQELDEKIKELQDNSNEEQDFKQQQEVMKKMNKLQEETRNKFKQEIQSAIEKIMDKEDYDIILDKNKVKYGGENITQEVIAILDSNDK